MAEDRATIQREMVAIGELEQQYNALQGLGGLSADRDKLVGGLAFVVGLVGAGAAANEALKIALGAGGDGVTVGLNAALAAAGVGYYKVRTGGGASSSSAGQSR